jgi:hypothetical protein
MQIARQLGSRLAATWFIILVVFAQERGEYLATATCFAASVALVLDDSRYNKAKLRKKWFTIPLSIVALVLFFSRMF